MIFPERPHLPDETEPRRCHRPRRICPCPPLGYVRPVGSPAGPGAPFPSHLQVVAALLAKPHSSPGGVRRRPTAPSVNRSPVCDTLYRPRRESSSRPSRPCYTVPHIRCLGNATHQNVRYPPPPTPHLDLCCMNGRFLPPCDHYRGSCPSASPPTIIPPPHRAIRPIPSPLLPPPQAPAPWTGAWPSSRM